MRKRTLIFVVFALSVVWVGLGIAMLNVVQAATTQAVSIKNLAYVPPALTIQVGDSVVWKNDETTPISHTTTSGTCSGTTCTPSAGWDSGFLNPGQMFTQTFTTAGTFPYFCKIHGSAMQGVIVVQASAALTPTNTVAATATNTTAPAASATNTSAPAATSTATATKAATATSTATSAATTVATPSTLPTTGGDNPGDPLLLLGVVALLVLGGTGIFIYARRA